jgi:hypothetical protein
MLVTTVTKRGRFGFLLATNCNVNGEEGVLAHFFFPKTLTAPVATNLAPSTIGGAIALIGRIILRQLTKMVKTTRRVSLRSKS